MITSEQEYQITQERMRQFRAADAADRADPLPDPAADAHRRTGVAGILDTLAREAALWEAGIREPVPGNPDLPSAAADLESRQAAQLLKHAEIAQIDRAIGEALDRIADWRRHRAWLEREIAALEAQAAPVA